MLQELPCLHQTACRLAYLPAPLYCLPPCTAPHPLPLPAVYRSNWLGAQGHEERKKLAEAEARLAAERQHAKQRGQMP